MTTEVLTVKGKPMPLDLLLFKRYQREVPGLVEQTYDANPGLAALGIMLPIGTAVTVTTPAPTVVAVRPLIRLTGA